VASQYRLPKLQHPSLENRDIVLGRRVGVPHDFSASSRYVAPTNGIMRPRARIICAFPEQVQLKLEAVQHEKLAQTKHLDCCRHSTKCDRARVPVDRPALCRMNSCAKRTNFSFRVDNANEFPVRMTQSHQQPDAPKLASSVTFHAEGAP
jgi:hypothetical protein